MAKRIMTDFTKAKIKKSREENRQLIYESANFTLWKDSLNWIAEIDGRNIYHSNLQSMCKSLLERRLKKAEVHDIQGLKEAIDQAVNEIIFHIPKAVR